jgi:hypothetical protein
MCHAQAGLYHLMLRQYPRLFLDGIMVLVIAASIAHKIMAVEGNDTEVLRQSRTKVAKRQGLARNQADMPLRDLPNLLMFVNMLTLGRLFVLLY